MRTQGFLLRTRSILTAYLGKAAITACCLCLTISSVTAYPLFAVIGDYGTGSSNEATVASMVNSWNPDFVITVGDNRYTSDYDETVGQFYCNYLADAGSGSFCPGNLNTTNAFFPSLGNHDYSDGGGLNEYLDYFTLPGNGIVSSNTSGNERYYDFIIGPVHFFVVDSDQAISSTADNTAQRNWLQAQLAASTSPWQVVYLHHAPFSSAQHGSISDVQFPYASWGADAVLAGHDHVYERLLVDNIPYFVNGLGGSSIYQFNTPVAGSQVRFNDAFGAMRVNASDNALSFEFIDFNGTIVDSYTVGAGAPAASFTHSCTALECTFTDTSIDNDGTISGWSWLFGDGTTSSEQNPVYSFQSAGNYTVILSVTDNDGAVNSISQPVFVPGTGGSACGSPSYDTATDNFLFLWKECTSDQWHVLLTGGGTSYTTFTGIIESTTGFLNVTEDGLEFDNGDILDTSDPNAIVFKMRTGGQWTDAFMFIPNDSTELCFRGDLLNSVTVLVGADALDVSPPFDPVSIQECYSTAENTAPIVTNPGNQTSVAGDTVSLNIVASDNQGDTLTYAATGLPENLDISQSTGVISGTIGGGGGSPYNVSVMVSDAELSTTVNFTWTVSPNNVDPVADFTFNCNGLDCTFTDASSDSDGNVVGWAWNFGDTNSSTAQSPSHTYSAAGTYTVTLTVTDNDGATDSTSSSVIVSEPPVPDTEEPSLTAPADVTVEATGVTTTVDLGSPIVSDNEDPNPVVSNNAPAAFDVGTTTVIWTATDASGNSATATQTVTVNDTTAPTITAPADVSVESSDPIAVALGTPTVSDLADPNPTVTHDAPALFPLGTTTVTWMVSDKYGNSASDTQDVTVSVPVPQPPAAPTGLTATVDQTGKGKKKVINSITLNWIDNSDNETGFAVEGCQEIRSGRGKNRTVTCDFVEIGSTGAGVTSFTVDISNEHDHFRVKAMNDVGSSAWSNEVKI
jgi:PKD repeat protein